MLADERASNVLILLCVGVLSLVNITLVLPKAGRLLQLLPKRWWDLSAQSEGACEISGNPSPKLVTTHLAMRRLDFVRRFLTVVEPALCVGLLIVGYHIWSGGPRWISPAQNVAALIAYFTVLVANHVPRASTLVGAYGAYAIFFWFMMVFVTSSNPETIYLSSLIFRFPRLLVSAAVLHIPLAIMSNVLYAIFVAWFVVLGGIDTPLPPHLLILDELINLGILAGVVSVFVKVITNETVQELAAKIARIDQCASHELLDGTFDVFVELDDELRMVQHFPRLGTILMLSREQSLKGARLQEFMPIAEDREEFQRRLLAPQRPEGCPTDVFYVTLCDKGARNLRMEVFTVHLTELSGGRRHKVAVREFSDMVPLVSHEAGGGGSTGESAGSRQDDAGDGRAPEAAVHRSGSAPELGSQQNRQCTTQRCELEGGISTTMEFSCFGARETVSSQSLVSWDNSVGTRHLQLGHLRETTFTAKKFSLIRVMYSWNVSVAPAACCPLHATLEDMRLVLQHLNQSECDNNFSPENLEQCPKCGILDNSLLPEHEHGMCVEEWNCSGFGRDCSDSPPSPRTPPLQHEGSPQQAIAL